MRKLVFLPKTELPEPDVNGIYNCDKCEYRSEAKFRYRKHKVIKHDGFSYNCEKCHNKFQSLERLKQHIGSLHEGIWFKCNRQFSVQSRQTRRKKEEMPVL